MDTPAFKHGVERLLGGEKERLVYRDDQTKKELLLFLRHGYDFGIMRTWILQGICELKDYRPEMEENGTIRKWLEVEIP